MRLKSFELFDSHMDLKFEDNAFRVYKMPESGRVYKRRIQYPLIHEFLFHKGILLGATSSNQLVFAQNSKDESNSAVVYEYMFAKGETIYEDRAYPVIDQHSVLNCALQLCQSEDPFNPVLNNCIIFVDRVYYCAKLMEAQKRVVKGKNLNRKFNLSKNGTTSIRFVSGSRR